MAKSLEDVIQKNLGRRSMKKIEKRLFEKFGISFTQSLTEFTKLDTILREFFGAGADGIEQKFFENLISIEKSKNKNNEWLTIEDPFLKELILTSFGDSDKKKILHFLSDNSAIVSDILKECKIPQTSGYRKINSLIEDGLLVVDEIIALDDGKKVKKYTTLFDNFGINIKGNKIVIKAQLKKKIREQSPIIQVVKGL